MSLANMLDSNDKKGLFASNDNFVHYGTGIVPLDYANGFWLKVPQKDGTVVDKPVVGLRGGSFVSIIGTTGTGKSTFADQVGYNIISQFPDGMLFHIDAELTNYKHRMLKIMGIQGDDDRVRLKKEQIYIEDVQDMINQICDVKKSNGDLFKYEVKGLSMDGKPFKAYVPTVFIVDSLPSFYSREMKTEDLGTNMDGARAAKDIQRFFVNNMAKMEIYNITVIMINHIRPKIKVDMFSDAPAGLMMLRNNESLIRGYAAQFFSQNYFRINSLKSNIYTVEDNGFSGFKSQIQIAKTKTAFIGSTVDVAFNGAIGFDPIYTLYEFAHSCGLVQGRNPWLYVGGLEQFKFNRKDFRHKFIGEPDFRDAFMEEITPYLEGLIGAKEVSSEDLVRYGEFSRIADAELENSDTIIDSDTLVEISKRKKEKAA